jgi:hypothetical protein
LLLAPKRNRLGCTRRISGSWTDTAFNVSYYRHIRSGMQVARTVQFRDGDYARLVDVASQRKLTK